MSTRKKIISVFFVVCGAAVAEFLTNVFLGRALTPDIFGRFKFIHTIVMTLGTLLVFGQDATLIRVLAGGNFKKYNWKKFIVQCFGISAVISAIALIFIKYYYQMGQEIYFVLFAIVSSVGIRLFASILRAYGKYAISMFFSRGFSTIFFVIISFFFVNHILPNFSLNQLLLWYVSSFIFILSLSLYFVIPIEIGLGNIEFSQIKDGIWLFLITISFTALANLNNFFIAKMMNYSDVATYSVCVTVTRGFDLVCSAIWYVMMPVYSKNKDRPILPDLTKVFCIGISIAVFYMLFGKFLIIFLFKGKYNNAITLLNFFIIIGIFKVLYAIPSGLIGGRLATRYLKIFFCLSIFSIAINVVGNYFLIPMIGIKGAVISTTFAWFFRLLSAYYILFLSRKFA